MWYPLGIPNDNHSITLPYRNRTRCDWLEITRREEDDVRIRTLDSQNV